MFDIGVKKGLLDPKHFRNMTTERSTSVWLFMWLVDKQTKELPCGCGLVLGGKPVKFEDVAKDLDYKIRLYRKHVENLREHKYIETIRTPHGLVFLVKNQKKRDGTIRAHHSSGYAHSCTSDSTIRAHQGDDSCTSNIRRKKTNSKTTPASRAKPMKKNKFGSYAEHKHSDDYEDAIDADTGAPVDTTAKDGRGQAMKALIQAAEVQRGRPFMNYGKQRKAIATMFNNGLSAKEIGARWVEMSLEQYWKDKGFDFMDVLNSFDKKGV